MNANTEMLMELMEGTREDFQFNYVGGAYFGDKNISMGKKAEVRHGEEIIDEFCEELIKHLGN